MSQLVRDLLAHKGSRVESIGPDAIVDAAIAHMNAMHIGALVVLTDGELIGIVTERDMLARVLAEHRDPLTTRVRDIMTSDVMVLCSHDSISRALQIVSDCRCRHLPVVDSGTLIGLVSAGDLTAWVVRDQRQTIEDLHLYITR